MQFLMIYAPSSSRPAGPPSPEYMDKMNQFVDASKKSGELIATGGLTPLQAGARVDHSAGKVSVTDGPFIESTEIIGGFALIELPSKEAAIESAKRFLKIAGDGQVTIRPLMDPSEVCADEPALAAHSQR